MQQPGFCWHVHHRLLLEKCYDYDGRAEYIRTDKSSHEQELRLRLFQPVSGQLPQEVVEAGKVYGEAEKVLNEAGKACDEAWKKVSGGALKAYDYIEAREAYFETWTAYLETVPPHGEALKAFEKALFNHKDEVEALHTEECRDCPWDGKTIFSAALAAV